VNTPRDYVRALVCHFPSRIRKTRLLLMLRAYIDDSKHIGHAGVAGGVYSLCGYVGDATKWEAFSDAWDAALHSGPRSLEYLKTVQANGLNDPESMFYGWTPQERDDKLLLLAQTVNRHALISIQAAIRPEDYKEILGGVTEMRVYHFLFYSVCSELVKLLERRWGIKDKIDIYFDRQTDESEDKLRAAFREFVAEAPADLRARFGGTPEFKDDREITPLQAADLMAWHFRRNIWEHDRGNKQGLISPAWTELLNLTRLTGIWGHQKLKEFVEEKQYKVLLSRPVTWMAYPDPSSGWGQPWK
jgi:hypothetical protein